jgi:hypothetical protein
VKDLPARTPEELADERSVRSIPLDTDDGRQVVIEQQNVGSANQVGGGEFKNATGRKSPAEAEAEQEELEAEAPIEAGGEVVGTDDGEPLVQGPNSQ